MPNVTIADDVLTGQGEPSRDPDTDALVGWEADPHFLVAASTGDHRALLPAVWAACRRFSTIDENGDELEDWELLGDCSTPSFVFDPVLIPGGVVMSADTSNHLSEPMGAAMVRVLAEELASRDLGAHVSALGDLSVLYAGDPAPDPDGDEEREGAGGGAGAPEPSFWYVCRPVWMTATTGRRYEDVEFRCEDGAWVRDRSVAQRWDQDSVDDMVALVEMLRTRADLSPAIAHGEVTGLRLPADPTVDPWPMPPSALRAADPDAPD